MAPGSIVFALANPTPEVHRGVAARYASIVATGRSDFPNQINNVLAFPGVFRGALDARARRITERMKVAAAEAIAAVAADDLRPDAIVPSALDARWRPPWRRPSPKPHPQIEGTGRCSLHMYPPSTRTIRSPGCPSVT